jgi:subtilase family serine protease
MSTRSLRFEIGARAMLAAVPLVCTLFSGVGQAAPVATAASTIPDIVASHTAEPVGAPPADQTMHVVVSLPLRHTEQLDALLRDIYNPASPNYRHYLSVAEFTDRFGPTAQDYETALSYFAKNGFTVNNHAANHVLISLDGKVADVERVFHVTMGLYRHPTEGRNFISADRLPTVDLSMPISQVIGLDDYVLPYNRLGRGEVTERATGSGPGGNFTGNDIRAAYYPSGTLTGAGQSIGLMELVGVNLADVTKFFADGYGPKNSVPIDLIKTDSEPVTCKGSCDDSEQALDIEYAISMAPGLSSMRVYVGKSPEDVLNAMASDNISKVLSTSWGWNENFATDDAIFKEFAAQGQTNLTASGDYSSLTASGPWPEEDANIVAVGGTDLVTNGAGGTWKSETGWKDSAGGPSTDKTIKIESYQLPYITTANGGSKTLRNVPDVAASANFDMYICADGTCTGGYGGTSFASPIWAGFIALANEQAIANGTNVVGFINPAIYALGETANYAAGFHDIVKGKSGKFSCTKSYDLVTGLGSPTGQGLINLLAP